MSDFLALSEKLSNPNVHRRLQEVFDSTPASAPLVIELDPTSVCDLSCPDCVSASQLGSRAVSGSRLKVLASELASSGVQAVVVSGGGEPLRHAAVPGFLADLVSSGVHVGLVTNGHSIRRLRPDVIAKLSYVRVSLDAGTEATYSRFRPSTNPAHTFQSLLESIRFAVNCGGDNVGLSYVVMVPSSGEDNIDELTRAARLAVDMGCAYFNPKAMVTPSHIEMPYTLQQRNRIRRQLDDIRSSMPELQLAVSANLRDLLEERSPQVKSYTRCLSSRLRMLLTPDGAFPCAYHRGNTVLQTPGIACGTLDEVWAARHTVDVNPSLHCKFHCARHESNVVMERMLASDPSSWAVRDGSDPFL